MATEQILTKDQIEEFHENGFLVLRNFASVEEIQKIIPIYRKLFDNKVGREMGLQFDLGGADDNDEREVLPQILGPSTFFPELKEGDHYKKVAQIAREIFNVPTDNVCGGDHAILKPAHYGSVTPWHQDEAYWVPDSIHEAFSVWMPLQDVTVESGCMQFIPGSHKNGILKHQHINNNPKIHALETFDYDETKAVACPLKMGDVTVHHCRTLHYTAANNTSKDRLALIVGGHGKSIKLDKPKDMPWNEKNNETPRAIRRKEYDEKNK